MPDRSYDHGSAGFTVLPGIHYQIAENDPELSLVEIHLTDTRIGFTGEGHILSLVFCPELPGHIPYP